jgi:hypothetical protein
MLLNLAFHPLMRGGRHDTLAIRSKLLNGRCDSLAILLGETAILRAVVESFPTLDRVAVEHGSLGVVVVLSTKNRLGLLLLLNCACGWKDFRGGDALGLGGPPKLLGGSGHIAIFVNQRWRLVKQGLLST